MSPTGYLPATLTRRDDFAPDLATFWLRPAERLAFEPGQYATLALEAGGSLVKRAYSIASAPHQAELELYVERVEGGALTPSLWGMVEGDTVLVRRKLVGHFTLDVARTQHAMAATVTGLAPFLSMVRHQVHRLERGPLDVVHRFLLLHGASHAAELGPYRAEVAALAEAHGWLDYVPTVSRPWADAAWSGETGRVEDVLRKWLDRLGFDPAQTAGYACGNPQMVEHAKGIFARARLAAEAIHEEKYFTLGGETLEPAEDGPPVAEPARRPPPGALKLKTVKRPPPL